MLSRETILKCLKEAITECHNTQCNDCKYYKNKMWCLVRMQTDKIYKTVEAETKRSKETAERDFYTIIKALEERKERVKAFYGIAESVGADIAIRTVKELAKQFGVEIKEL